VFEIGRVYHRRRDIHGPYGGSWQSGIAPSGDWPLVFLFTGQSAAKCGYDDERTEHRRGNLPRTQIGSVPIEAARAKRCSVDRTSRSAWVDFSGESRRVGVRAMESQTALPHRAHVPAEIGAAHPRVGAPQPLLSV
jgi:hypothetical protein